MDCYFGHCVDDLVVPGSQEALDRLPSPNSWSQWGVSASEICKPMNKYIVTSIGEEPSFYEKSLYQEVDMDLSSHDAEHSSNSNLYQEFQETSLQHTISPCESPDYQLNDLSGTDRTNDIFFSSMLEEGPTGVNSLYGPFGFYPEYEYGEFADDDLFTDMIRDSEDEPSHLFGMGSSKHAKPHAFSPSLNWGHGEVANLPDPRHSKQKDNPPREASVATFSASSELDVMNEHVDEEASLEVSVLLELERVMTQLSEKTRICFRDALYRLAENTEQHAANHSQNVDLIPEKPPPLAVHGESLRSENSGTMESETNAIDRAVANLMFSKMVSGAQALPAEEQLNFKQAANQTTGQCYYSSSQPQPQPPHFRGHLKLTGDAEVPIFV